MPRAGLSTAAVVAAAAEIADAEGLDRLTLARVAAAAGVRTPSLYNHVESLDDVRRRVALLALADLADALRDAAVGRAGDDALAAMADAYRAYARRHPGRYAATQRAPAEVISASKASRSAFGAIGSAAPCTARTAALMSPLLAGCGVVRVPCMNTTA